MIPRCPVCNSLAGTSRTAAGKRMWCTAPGCTWSTVVAEAALTGRDMCAVGTTSTTRVQLQLACILRATCRKIEVN